jgi:hypothetical protein
MSKQIPTTMPIIMGVLFDLLGLIIVNITVVFPIFFLEKVKVISFLSVLISIF